MRENIMLLHQELQTDIYNLLINEYTNSQELIDRKKIQIDKPQRDYGDLCTTCALNFAKALKTSPLNIANFIKEQLDSKYSELLTIEVTPPGFVNFFLKDNALAQLLETLSTNELIRKVSQPEDIILEYVSANPTGDLHLGHGRGAVLGSALASLLKHTGQNVSTEFYINDAGEQINKLTRSAWSAHNNLEITEDEYPPQLIKPYLYDIPESITQEELGDLVKKRILVKQKEVLAKLQVNFDTWTSEKEEIHNTGKLQDTIDKFKSKGLIYEDGGAVWLKSTKLGDDRDRVLIKSQNQKPTYLMGDFAYHCDKFSRANKLIDIWGADHAGQDISLKLGLEALGQEKDNLEVLFIQLVSLQRNGQDVKMSKRTGEVITIEEVLDEVGSDAFRTNMLTSNVNNRLIFDIDIVKQASDQNPAFYLQYSHARASGIIRRAGEPNPETQEILPPMPEKINYLPAFNSELITPEEYKASKTLLLKLLFFNREIHRAGDSLNPCHVLNYLLELAQLFHSFYNVPCKVIDYNNIQLSHARLSLVQLFKDVMKQGLDILLIKAPETM